ncbi:MAG: hypothetical protein HKN25_17150 [Pyrinomonadaceae bacterium]|nr:hypothetical protein [Pyrinomonadaceae bacterium]
MGRYKNALTAITLSVMVMGLSIAASAQWRNSRGNNDYYGNAGYNRNLNSTINNLERKARRFEDVLDRELDRSQYNGSRREDQLNNLAKRFKNAAEDLADEYDNQRDYNRSRDEAQKVLSLGSQLGSALRGSRANRNPTLQSSWRSIRQDLRSLSQAYNTNYNNGRYNRNDRNNRNRNDRYNRNRNRNRNQRGTYGGGYNGNLRSTIVNLRNRSARFEDRIDRERDNNNGRYGRRVSSNLENLTDRFHDAVKDLENEFDNDRDYNDSYDEVRKVLSLGEQVDREVSRSRASRSIRSDWNAIERDLRTIARAYNLNYRGNSRNYGRIGDIIRNFPF